MRLDRWLVSKDPSLGRKGAKVLCVGGNVSVNGRPASKSMPLTVGAVVSFPSSLPREAIGNADLSLDIRFENDHCVIVCKVAGQPTAPLDPFESGTLANALLGHFPAMRSVGNNPLEPGLIHRLDNGTSGLLIAAKSRPAFEDLKRALTQGEIAKEYVAIVHDRSLPDGGLIDSPLAAHKTRRVVVAQPGARGARPAETRFRVTARASGLAVVSVEAKKALRHQIRAHLASIDCPLANDELYGGARVPSLAPGRHALHARRVAWPGNPHLPGFDISAGLPADLVAWLQSVGFT